MLQSRASSFLNVKFMPIPGPQLKNAFSVLQIVFGLQADKPLLIFTKHGKKM